VNRKLRNYSINFIHHLHLLLWYLKITYSNYSISYRMPSLKNNHSSSSFSKESDFFKNKNYFINPLRNLKQEMCTLKKSCYICIKTATATAKKRQSSSITSEIEKCLNFFNHNLIWRLESNFSFFKNEIQLWGDWRCPKNHIGLWNSFCVNSEVNCNLQGRFRKGKDIYSILLSHWK